MSPTTLVSLSHLLATTFLKIRQCFIHMWGIHWVIGHNEILIIYFDSLWSPAGNCFPKEWQSFRHWPIFHRSWGTRCYRNIFTGTQKAVPQPDTWTCTIHLQSQSMRHQTAVLPEKCRGSALSCDTGWLPPTGPDRSLIYLRYRGSSARQRHHRPRFECLYIL